MDTRSNVNESPTQHDNDGSRTTATEPTATSEPQATSEAQAASEPPMPEPIPEPIPDRKRIEDQLEALKRREHELRRELAMADHPELAAAIRELEGCAYCVTRADAKLAQGLTKAEERRRETLSGKIAALQAKRDKLDAQLQELHDELAALGEDRIRGFERERQEALESLVRSLGAHTAALKAAELEVTDLLPQIGPWMPEIRALAEALVERAKAGSDTP